MFAINFLVRCHKSVKYLGSRYVYRVYSNYSHIYNMRGCKKGWAVEEILRHLIGLKMFLLTSPFDVVPFSSKTWPF